MIKFIQIISVIGAVLMIKASYASPISVKVSGIDIKRKGELYIMLYSEVGFPKDHSKSLMIKKLTVNKSTTVVNFYDVPEVFAIKVHHDEDGTGQVSKNWTGIIPSEGLGFSNNARVRFGPPNFKQAKLTLKKILEPVQVNIVYP